MKQFLGPEPGFVVLYPWLHIVFEDRIGLGEQ